MPPVPEWALELRAQAVTDVQNFNGGPPPSQEQVYSFMGQTTQWLDAQPFV